MRFTWSEYICDKTISPNKGGTTLNDKQIYNSCIYNSDCVC